MILNFVPLKICVRGYLDGDFPFPPNMMKKSVSMEIKKTEIMYGYLMRIT